MQIRHRRDPAGSQMSVQAPLAIGYCSTVSKWWHCSYWDFRLTSWKWDTVAHVYQAVIVISLDVCCQATADELAFNHGSGLSVESNQSLSWFHTLYDLNLCSFSDAVMKGWFNKSKKKNNKNKIWIYWLTNITALWAVCPPTGCEAPHSSLSVQKIETSNFVCMAAVE